MAINYRFLAVALAFLPATGKVEKCYEGKDVVPLACLHKEANERYQKGMTDACSDVGGYLITQSLRPKCVLAYWPMPGTGLMPEGAE